MMHLTLTKPRDGGTVFESQLLNLCNFHPRHIIHTHMRALCKTRDNVFPDSKDASPAFSRMHPWKQGIGVCVCVFNVFTFKNNNLNWEITSYLILILKRVAIYQSLSSIKEKVLAEVWRSSETVSCDRFHGCYCALI